MRLKTKTIQMNLQHVVLLLCNLLCSIVVYCLNIRKGGNGFINFYFLSQFHSFYI